MRIIALCWLTAMCPAGASGTLPADVVASIRSRIEAKDNAGIVVGLVTEEGTQFSGFGHTSLPNGPTPDEDTVFEIGSITKVFTALLLTDMVERGALSLDTPLATLLPEDLSLPERSGESITLRMLAAHASGLPRVPDNFHPSDLADPYRDYTVDHLYDFLRLYSIPKDAPAYQYSNLGFGLLGHALCLEEDTSYDSLVRQRIAVPLKLLDTRVEPSPDMRRRLAQGHRGPVPASSWTMPVFAGAGGLHSTARDLAALLSAYLDPGASPLREAMAATLKEQGPADAPSIRMCLAWHRLGDERAPIYWQNGGTGGYNGLIAFAPAARRGVAVLSNSTDIIDDIGFHLLDPSIPLRKPWKLHPIDGEWLHACAGRYRFDPGAVLETQVMQGILTARFNNQPQHPIYPVSASRFTYRAVPAELEFETDDDGKVVAVILHQDGREQRATRE